jgi:hypothetical protein
MPLTEHLKTCQTIKLSSCKMCGRDMRIENGEDICSACHFISCDGCSRCNDIAVGVVVFFVEDDANERRLDREKRNRQWGT